MAFRTNYRFERLEREKAKKAKKEEKSRRRQDVGTETSEQSSTPDEAEQMLPDA
jgi:hypothetical protein